jgi:glucan 1,3-beta-glucosidase
MPKRTHSKPSPPSPKVLRPAQPSPQPGAGRGTTGNPPKESFRSGLARWLPALFYALALLPLLAFWWWQGRGVELPDAPSARVPCVSFAPYQGSQSPFDEQLVLPKEQLERDLLGLRDLTTCVRTYAVNQGLEAVPEIASRLGMTVMLGVWIGRENEKNEREITRAVELARRFPETITSVIVGNEVLLRREQPPEALAAMIRRVGNAVPMPVTYADVWEFWQAHPEVAKAVDFVTIHTLPYWEDDPWSIEEAVPHVQRIWRAMAAEFAGVPVFIGEAGWPSAGRMREGARPSLVNQARFVREMMILAARDGIGLNLIESFDQPWKRKLEGTVGGHWGLYDGDRQRKFALTGTVAENPRWLQHFALAAALGAVLLAPALSPGRLSAGRWLSLAAGAVVAGSLLVSGGHDGLLGARTIFDWAVLAVRWTSAALAAGLVLHVLSRPTGSAIPRPAPISELIEAVRGRRRWRVRPWRETAFGALRATALFGAAATTLCLIFDPRYRDFSAALYAVPALAFLVLSILGGASERAAPSLEGKDGWGVTPNVREEILLAGVLVAGGLAIPLLEGFENWQALTWAAATVCLAASVGVECRWNRAAPYRRTSASAPSNAPPAAGSGA